jgi:glycerophosphoryl diester phosphodiesterase
MKILAHRGHWREPREKNGFAAFKRAWANRYGIETDLRDRDRNIVISHDPADASAASFESFLQAYAEHGRGTTLALNIKADGLCNSVAQSLARHSVEDFFVFDMSVPDSLQYLRAGMPVFLRLSEHEPKTDLFGSAAGVWLDAFARDWWTLDTLREIHAAGKFVAIVSPELHKRPHEALWRALRELEPGLLSNFLLCTDFPEDADVFFQSHK